MKTAFALPPCIFLLCAVLMHPLSIEAQNALGCDGKRYVNALFPDTTQTVVQYGENLSLSGSIVNLFMDVIEPKGDVQARRPLVVMATGGGFVNANRRELSSVCAYFAQRGYVCATIDYRLFEFLRFLRLPDSIDIAKVGTQAAQDFKAAVRYFWRDAATQNRFRIDTNNIIAAGVSAGAITALSVGMLDSTDAIPAFYRTAIAEVGGFEGISGNPGYPTRVKAVVNNSGALYRKEFLDANDPPLASYHGTADNIVPYGFAPNVYNFYSDGSGELFKRTQTLNKPSVLFTVPDGGHETLYRNGRTGVIPQSFIDWSVVWADFMKRTVCGEPIQTFTATQEFDNQSVTAFPNPAENAVTFALDANDGDNIADITIYDVQGRAVFFDKNQSTPQYILQKKDVGQGLYFAQVRRASGRLAFKKIIFQ